MADLTPEEEKAVAAIYAYAAELKKTGKSIPEIQQALMEQGIDEASANAVAENIDALSKEANSGAGLKNMAWGAIWCIGGIIITAATYSAASDGGTYVVTYGAIIIGGIQFFVGVFQAVSART